MPATTPGRKQRGLTRSRVLPLPPPGARSPTPCPSRSPAHPPPGVRHQVFLSFRGAIRSLWLWVPDECRRMAANPACWLCPAALLPGRRAGTPPVPADALGAVLPPAFSCLLGSPGLRRLCMDHFERPGPSSGHCAQARDDSTSS